MSSNLLRWLPSWRELDHEQQTAVTDALKPGNMLVHGPAGSGKTAITLFCGKTLHDLGRSFKIIVYTNVLLRFIEAGAADLKLPADSFTTLYRWVWRLHEHQLGRPPDYSDDKYSRWVDNLIAHWRRHPSSIPSYEYILVDEAQDFPDNVSVLLHMMSPNLLIVADPSQSLYVDTKDRETLVRRWSPLANFVEIPNSYRNPTSIAAVAALFLDSHTCTVEGYLRRVKGRSGNMKPILYQAHSSEEQIDRVCQIISEARGSVRIGILYRHRKHLERDSRMLAARRIQVQIALTQNADIDFNRSVPVLTTAHSAKGLEFDWVILPSLDRDKWDGNPEDDRERNLFFVVLTRAKERLYFVSTKGRECAFLSKILDERPDLVQSPRQVAGRERTYQSAIPAASIDDDDPF